jgi:type I restriction enzyme S subunit
MKGSGVEWIGEIPVDKSLKKIKSILKVFEKSKIQVNESDVVGDFPFFTSSKKLSKKINYPLLENKEVIIMGTGGFANVHYYKGDLSYSTDCWCITSTENVKFLYYYLTSIREAINTLGFNGMGLKHLQKEFINSNYVVSFDNKEQEKIVKYLDDKTSKIDNSLEEIESKINHLKEYKKTLINDSVTGKIKVYQGDV